MKRTTTTWGIPAAIFMILLASVGVGVTNVASAPISGGTLVIGLDQEPPTLDPQASPQAATFQIMGNVSESLLYQGTDGKLVPWLATAYTVSPDGKSFTFTLHTDAIFSDGTSLDALAVKWNFDRIMNPSFKAGISLLALQGYAGSSVIDGHTVRVDFKAPYAPFLTYLAGGSLPLLSPKATEAQGTNVNLKPVGSGPFAVAEYAPKDHITLTRNANYTRRAPWSDHRGAPYLDRVVWRFIPEADTRVTTLQSGETQMITFASVPAGILPGLADDKTLRVEKTPYPGAPRTWLLNVRLAPTNDPKVRQALEYGVNRAAFVDSVYKGLGTPACGPLTARTLSDPPLCSMYPYDPKRAAQILDDDGWRTGANNIREKDGKPLTLVINSINYGGGNRPEVELLQGQLLSLGINAIIKTQSLAPWFEDNNHCATNGPVLFLRGSDPDLLFAQFDSANIGGNFNWSCFSSQEVDGLLQRGRQVFGGNRLAIYRQISQLLMQQAVEVPLFDELSVWIMRGNIADTKYDFSAYPILSDVYVRK